MRRAELLETIKKVRFDVNALTIESFDRGTPANIHDISKLFRELHVPLIINEHIQREMH